MRAKFLRKEKSEYWGYDYYLECMDCGKEYTSKRLDDRTSPYCGACYRKHNLVRKGIREKQKKQAEINEVLDKIYADIQRLRGCSCSCSDGIIDDIEDILDKYKAESEVKE